MNKKLICGILACAMAVTSAFSLSACKEKPDDIGEGGNGGNSGNGGNGGMVIEPGTVITDTAVRSELFKELSEAEIGGFTYSASASISVKDGNATQVQKYLAEGSVLISESEVQADVFASIAEADGEETVGQYMLCFLRKGALYTAFGEEENEVDFAELKKALKAKEDPIVLGREETELTVPKTLLKLVRNMPALGEGTVTKTEGGYTVDIDVMATLDSVLEGIGSLGAAVDQNHAMTLGGLFGQEYFKTTVEKLLNGITAPEIKETLEAYLPERFAKELPDAAEKGTAASYLEGLLRSGTFYKAIVGEREAWKQFKTFAEVPLETIISVFTGEEFSFGDIKIKDRVEELKDNLEEGIVSLLMGFIGLDEGELKDEDVELVMSFAFGDDKKLLGFSLEGAAEGSRLPAPAQEPEEEPQEPGQEEGEPQEQETAKINEDEAKKTARGTIKLAAACVSSPQLFDLTGCKYYKEEGGTATIPAEK